MTKEENALLSLWRAMQVVKVEPIKKKTLSDIRLEVHKDWVLAKSKKNLC